MDARKLGWVSWLALSAGIGGCGSNDPAADATGTGGAYASGGQSGSGSASGAGGTSAGGAAGGAGAAGSAGAGGATTGGTGGQAGGAQVAGTCNDNVDNDGDGVADAQDDDCRLVNQFEASSADIANGYFGGWNRYVPSADTRIVYVSAAGDDAADGLSEATAKKTVGAALSLLRDGYPDWLLLRRGDTFQTAINWSGKSGRSETERMLIGSYGASPQRPRLHSGVQMAFKSINGASHLALVGIHFYADARDPSSPTFDAAQTASPAGIVWQASLKNNTVWSNFRVEDCVIQAYGIGLTIQDRRSDPIMGAAAPAAPPSSKNFELLRSLVIDNHSRDNSHSQGMYAHGISGLTLIDNVFDRNGWLGSRDTGPGKATIFNHNLYIDTEHNDKLVFRGNVVMRASSHGLQARTGGIIEDNLFVENPLHLLVGGGDHTEPQDYQPNGVDGVVKNNVFLLTTDISSSIPRGLGIETSNIHTLVVEKNVLAHGGFATNHRGIRLVATTQASQPKHDVTGNVVFDWERGFENLGAKGLTRTGNVFSDTDVTGTSDQKSETFAFPDPTRGVDGYLATLGKPGTTDALATELRQQGKTNWRNEYTAQAINAWVRAGFVAP
ncbi:MAG: hypothetical protein U0263_26550 [Polyangiaceae bacterium]